MFLVDFLTKQALNLAQAEASKPRLYDYCYDEIKGDDQKRFLNRLRTLCAAIVWALMLVMSGYGMSGVKLPLLDG